MALSGAVCTVSVQADLETSGTLSRLQGTYREESPGVYRREDGEFYLLRVEDVPGLKAAAEPGWCFASDLSGKARLAWAASQGAAQPAEAGWLAEAEDGWQGAAAPVPLTVAHTEAPRSPEDDARPLDCLLGALEATYEALTHPDTQQCMQSAAQQTCGLAKELWAHAWVAISAHAQRLCADRGAAHGAGPLQRPAAPAAAARPAADEVAAPAPPAAAEQHEDALSAASEVVSEELDQETASITDADADELASELGWDHVQLPDAICGIVDEVGHRKTRAA
ncbi:unnamed protein product [Prorocentrum cordatum]|uniref:Uncharacterized protein n=1 Tax=Prorocentrum cordatum TaxID=2364126 RepID=A0ABN9VCM4_9DINO|nr:unnamed protein product [Polarella glacialis]